MKPLEELSKEELLTECKYSHALIQTLINKNAQLNLQLAHYETQAQMEKQNQMPTQNE